jgi:hypothetical protein
MTMKWKQDEAETKPYLIHNSGDIRLSVGDADKNSNEQWQHLCLSLGKFSLATTDECMDTWPRAAILEARRQLDDFEKLLNQENSV